MWEEIILWAIYVLTVIFVAGISYFIWGLEIAAINGATIGLVVYLMIKNFFGEDRDLALLALYIVAFAVFVITYGYFLIHALGML